MNSPHPGHRDFDVQSLSQVTRMKLKITGESTVLPVFEKLFEMAAQRRLEFVSEAFQTEDRYNGGFKKGSRTTDNIYILQSIIEKQLLLGQQVIVIYVDFSRAFDLINRNILFYKIKKSGLKGRLINTLYNLYQRTSFRIKYQAQYSDAIEENIRPRV